MEWISCKDRPLFNIIDDKGTWEATEEGNGEFLAAVSYTLITKPDEILWWVRHCVLESNSGLCVVGEMENEPAGYDMSDVTHYVIIKPPKTI